MNLNRLPSFQLKIDHLLKLVTNVFESVNKELLLFSLPGQKFLQVPGTQKVLEISQHSTFEIKGRIEQSLLIYYCHFHRLILLLNLLNVLSKVVRHSWD